MRKNLANLQVNDSVWFINEEDNEYKVRAKRENFIIATRKSDSKKYTIIDTDKSFCGPDDRTFQFINYTTTEGCETALNHLINGVLMPNRNKPGEVIKIYISQRNGANVKDVVDLDRTLN